MKCLDSVGPALKFSSSATGYFKVSPVPWTAYKKYTLFDFLFGNNRRPIPVVNIGLSVGHIKARNDDLQPSCALRTTKFSILY